MFGLRAELFANGFVKTIAQWCAAHHIQLTGHVDQEEVVNPVGLCGDLIKAFQYQPIPGLDQIFAYDRGSCMYKVVSSAAVNYGRSLVMTECYGAIDLPVPNLYREAMDQFAKGVNLMVPHAVWYRTDPIMFPPELSYRTERYASELPRYNQYIGRLQRVLQQGRPLVDIAVLYPIHGLQSAYYFGPGEPYKGGVIPKWADYMDVGERLSLDVRHDFTYLHPETLDAHCQVNGGMLELQSPAVLQQYRLLILPGMEAVSAANLAKIKAYFDQGGHVIATTRLPDRSAEPGKNDEVQATIRHIFGVESVRSVVNRNAQGGSAQFVASPSVAALQQAVNEALPQPDVQLARRTNCCGRTSELSPQGDRRSPRVVLRQLVGHAGRHDRRLARRVYTRTLGPAHRPHRAVPRDNVARPYDHPSATCAGHLRVLRQCLMILSIPFIPSTTAPPRGCVIHRVFVVVVRSTE